MRSTAGQLVRSTLLVDGRAVITLPPPAYTQVPTVQARRAVDRLPSYKGDAGRYWAAAVPEQTTLAQISTAVTAAAVLAAVLAAHWMADASSSAPPRQSPAPKLLRPISWRH